MREESGRSLIEIIGVLAIAGIMTAGVITTYNIIRSRQVRTIAVSDMEQIAKNTKLLLGMYGNYNEVSVDYLIKAGALDNSKPPIGTNEWSITPSIDGKEFLINLTGLSRSDCEYFTVAKFSWVSYIIVNNNETDPGIYCLGTGGNNVSLVIE